MSLFETRCPRCGNLSDVELVSGSINWGPAIWNTVAAVASILIPFMPFLPLVHKCLKCQIYFAAREIWTEPDKCIKCGYNLTGNTSGVCPECGTAVTSPSEPPAS